MIRTTAMYITFLPFQSAGRQQKLSHCNICQDQDQQFASPFGLYMVQVLTAELTCSS